MKTIRPQIVKHIKTGATTLLCFLISNSVFGQGPPPPVEDPVPIDSGLLLLLLVGVGYGIYITIKRVRSKNISQ
ncbi:MAG: PID-CTERM protein-sorting domain-containing protein [Flavobacteriales bacterium]